jgi:hypothetical protein
MGLQHICANLKIFGNEIDGSFAQYLAVPETSLWPLTDDVTYEIGAVMEPLGGAVQAVLVEPVTAKSVVIFGDGPIGLFAIGVAKAAGARKVTMVGTIPERLEIAEQMGADVIFNNRQEEVDAAAEILKDTDGIGVDVCVEMAGAHQTIQQAFNVVRKGGRVTLFGISSKPPEFDFNYNVILRQVTVRGVAGRHMWDTWVMLDGLLEAGLNPEPVITCREGRRRIVMSADGDGKIDYDKIEIVGDGRGTMQGDYLLNKDRPMDRTRWLLECFPEWGQYLNREIEKTEVKKGTYAMWWTGGMGFVLKSPGGAVLLIDNYAGPYEYCGVCRTSGSPTIDWLRLNPQVIDIFGFKELDAVFCSHQHADHTDIYTLKAATQTTDCQFYAPACVPGPGR